VQRIGFRHQRTLRQPVTLRGVGIVGGLPVRLRFVPAPADTGLAFVRSDLPNRPTTLATADRVSDTNRRTTLGLRSSGVTLVEHVLSALAGMRIDNCLIELDQPEPPGLDGSAAGFVAAINQAGIVTQSSRRPIYASKNTIMVESRGATIALHPPVGPSNLSLSASYILDYAGKASLPRQMYTLPINPTSFQADLSQSRTFLLESEIQMLRSQGVGQHMTTSDILVFGERGVINNSLRQADEPARHKILDLIGDLALTGVDLAGHLVAYRSGHALNVALAKTLVERIAAEDDVLPTRVSLPQRQRAA
jgi:UDP-3-O-[3-hydroxymyristoyl] N-acetylglucosamine deacetylase